MPGFRVAVSDYFSDELKGVDSLRDRSAIDLVRSEAYLRWRFDENPEHKYTYIIANERDELRAYATISIQEEGESLRNGMIVDYLVKNNNIDCFRELM